MTTALITMKALYNTALELFMPKMTVLFAFLEKLINYDEKHHNYFSLINKTLLKIYGKHSNHF